MAGGCHRCCVGVNLWKVVVKDVWVQCENHCLQHKLQYTKDLDNSIRPDSHDHPARCMLSLLGIFLATLNARTPRSYGQPSDPLCRTRLILRSKPRLMRLLLRLPQLR